MLVDVISAMVEPEFGFLQMQVEHMSLDALHLGQTQLGVGPEGFDAVDVGLVVGEFVAAMIDSKVFGVTDVYQAVIAAPAIAVDDAVQRHLAANDLLQRGFPGIRYDLGDDPAVALEQAEDDGLATCTAPSFAAHAARAEIGFVHFDLAAQIAVPFTFLRKAVAQFDVDGVDRAQADAGQTSCIGCRQIQREVTQDASKRTFCDSRTAVVPDFPCHFRSLDHVFSGLTS